MIRHIAELGAWVLCFAVGVSLLAALGIGLLLIWGKRPDGDSTLEDEYRRVEAGGIALETRPLEAWEQETAFELAEDLGFPFSPYVPTASRPYDWATREPMVWGKS